VGRLPSTCQQSSSTNLVIFIANTDMFHQDGRFEPGEVVISEVTKQDLLSLVLQLSVSPLGLY
jgi:hypothetical protein